MTPSRPPGPWFLAQAPSKLSIRPASTSMRPPRCDDFQRFERAKSSAGLGAHPPYCADRFCGGRVPASRRRAHRSWWGLRAKWPHAKCGAAALFCGVPPRLTPWAVRNSLGHTRPKMSRLIEFHGFLPFLRLCALIPIPVEPIAPRIREWSPQPSKAGVAPISIRGKARLETRLTPHRRCIRAVVGGASLDRRPETSS